MKVHPNVDIYTVPKRNHGKTEKRLPKNAEHNNQLKTQRILNTQMQAKWGPIFYIYLSKAGASLPCIHVSYATVVDLC